MVCAWLFCSSTHHGLVCGWQLVGGYDGWLVVGLAWSVLACFVFAYIRVLGWGGWGGWGGWLGLHGVGLLVLDLRNGHMYGLHLICWWLGRPGLCGPSQSCLLPVDLICRSHVLSHLAADEHAPQGGG